MNYYAETKEIENTLKYYEETAEIRTILDYYEEIRKSLINNEITKRVKDYSKNKSDLETRYNVGKLLDEVGKHYGESIVKEYAIKLTNDLKKKYEYKTLRKMCQFYLLISKLSTVSRTLTYSHYLELLTLDNIDEVNYYINIAEEQNLTVRELRAKIKSKEYERLPEETKNKLIKKEETDIKDLVPNPIIIRNPDNKEIITESTLHNLILEHIENFMKELGSGFAFIGSEYKIRIGNTYNYLDLLLFNVKYNAYVVVELKVTELKKDHIGQILTYMNYIDNEVKEPMNNKTIGLIIVKQNNQYVVGYSSDKRIISREYELVTTNN